MRIAIVGTGISGLVSAHLLHPGHEITLFEAGGHIGGHTQTVRVERPHGRYDIDTGFVVFNETTYPLFLRLLHRLEVPYDPTDMSFSVRCESTGLEYNGTSLNTLFAQRRNLLRPRFHRMLRDIVRFNHEAKEWLRRGPAAPELGTLLAEGGYSPQFLNHYLVPMGSAIWSTRPSQMLRFPAYFLLRFLDNHGLLSVNGQYPWQVIRGGSQSYVEAMVQPFRNRIRLNAPVTGVRREARHVVLSTRDGSTESFDHVILATHSDTALSLLDDPDEAEREILGAIPFEENDVVLHTDDSLLPRSNRARASWNYHLLPTGAQRVTTTYNMNLLQGIEAPETFCVTLNRTADIEPDSILGRYNMAHPVFTEASVRAQTRHLEISGERRTHYCGAYWGNGFHEDGVRSAVAACSYFGVGL